MYDVEETIKEIVTTGTGIGVDSTLVLARGISEYTLLVIAAAAFIFISLIMNVIWWYFSKKQIDYMLTQHNTLIQGIINSQQTKLDGILEYAKQTENKLNQLKEAITGQEFNKIRVSVTYGFDFNKLSIALFINETKSSNNLDNRSGVEKSVRMTVDNLYNRFVNEMDNFEYNGRKVSFFFDIEWKERVYEFCLYSIYDGKQHDCFNYIKSLNNYFEEFKVKFFEKLRNS